MKNYQQSVKQRRVKLDKLKHAFAISHKVPEVTYANEMTRGWKGYGSNSYWNALRKRDARKAMKLVLGVVLK